MRPRLPRFRLNPAPLVRVADPLLPFSIKRRLLELPLNRILKVPLEEGEFDFLEHRLLGIQVEDMNLRLVFSLRDGRFVLLRDTLGEATIKGQWRDFLQLMNRSEDPDTLFFQRRLLIEGDTELGLCVKNLLDSLDWEELHPLLVKGINLLQRVVAEPS